MILRTQGAEELQEAGKEHLLVTLAQCRIQTLCPVQESQRQSISGIVYLCRVTMVSIFHKQQRLDAPGTTLPPRFSVHRGHCHSINKHRMMILASVGLPPKTNWGEQVSTHCCVCRPLSSPPQNHPVCIFKCSILLQKHIFLSKLLTT